MPSLTSRVDPDPVLNARIVDSPLTQDDAGLAGLSDADCESVYAIGHALYTQARYEDALTLFGWLTVARSWECRFVFAFGSCLHALGRYEPAIDHYAIALLIDINEPAPLLHTCECLLALNRFEEAQEVLDTLRQEYPADSFPAIDENAEKLAHLIEAGRSTTQGRKK